MKRQQHFIIVLFCFGACGARAQKDKTPDGISLQNLLKPISIDEGDSELMSENVFTDEGKLLENEQNDNKLIRDNRTKHNENLSNNVSASINDDNSKINPQINELWSNDTIIHPHSKIKIPVNKTTEIGLPINKTPEIGLPINKTPEIDLKGLSVNHSSLAGSTNFVFNRIVSEEISPMKSMPIIDSSSRGDSDPLVSMDDSKIYPEDISNDKGIAEDIHPEDVSDNGEVADNIYPEDVSKNVGIVDNIYPVGDSNDERTENGHANNSLGVSPPSVKMSMSSSTLSWLDAFMYQYRDSYWIMFNTFFMVIWVLVGIFSLYRLFGLPWCSPYISKTIYLIIHLLIFTAATFEFVQLIHLSYGSHKGLPLFLTLLLTHTPTPCLAASLILMIYCIFSASSVSIVCNYLPLLLYVGILSSFIIVLSFVGDIIVGASRNSIVLIVIRILLNSFCLTCFLAFISNYKNVIQAALLLRREFRGDLNTSAIPVNIPEENREAKLHLKKILILWTRVTLISCIAGVCMCICSFSLSLFFTISYVPLWAFWVLHSSIFVSQIVLVIGLTFSAALTLTYTNVHNIFYKYFVPSLANQRVSNKPFIKHGNFIYERVVTSNGLNSSHRMSAHPIEVSDQSNLRNNNLITELTTAPFRSNVNLKRSATFNCAPLHGFQGVVYPRSLCPVLSDHYLVSTNLPNNPEYENDELPGNSYDSRNFPYGNTNEVRHIASGDREVHYRPVGRYPPREIFSSLRSIPYNSNHTNPQMLPVNLTNENLITSSSGFVGTVQALEIPLKHNNVPAAHPDLFQDQSFIRYIPINHSFSSTPRSRQEPPEKPARKTEPVLVKGVIMESAEIKKTVCSDKNFILQPPATSNPVFIKNPKVDNSEGKPFCVRDKESRNLSNNTPYIKNIELNIPTRNPILKNNFKVDLPKANPISHASLNDTNKFLAATPCSGADAISSDSNVLSRTANPLSSPKVHLFPSTIKTVGVAIKENCHNNDEVDKVDLELTEVLCADNNEGCKSVSQEDADISLSPNSYGNLDSDSVFHAHKKCQPLRRNNSTAGYFPTESVENEPSELPESNTNMKYPWYGTWGGRRPKRTDSFPNSETSSSLLGSKLRRLSTSKGSLSSLYGKLKPKRSKSMYQNNKTMKGEDFLDENTGETEEEEASADLDFAQQEVEESEEEEFLKRLDEDIDLASEIFKSSTVLADFYSLKRSDLKNRRNACKEEEHKEEFCNEQKFNENVNKTMQVEGKEAITNETPIDDGNE